MHHAPVLAAAKLMLKAILISFFLFLCQPKTNLIIGDEIVRIFRQKVPELFDVLTGNVPDFRRGLGPVPEQALDRDFGADAVLEKKPNLS